MVSLEPLDTGKLSMKLLNKIIKLLICISYIEYNE